MSQYASSLACEYGFRTPLLDDNSDQTREHSLSVSGIVSKGPASARILTGPGTGGRFSSSESAVDSLLADLGVVDLFYSSILN